MFSVNLNANQTDAINKLSRWGFTQDVDYHILPSLYDAEMKQRFHSSVAF